MSYEEALSVLGLSGDESAEQTKRAYLKLVKQHGPDRDPEGFRRVREAYDVLRARGEFLATFARARHAGAEPVPAAPHLSTPASAPLPAAPATEPSSAPEPLEAKLEPPAPPKPELVISREPVRDPWAFVRLPKGAVVQIATASSDFEERLAAITALAERGDFAEAGQLLPGMLCSEAIEHGAAVFLVACKVVVGLHAIGGSAPAGALLQELKAWSGDPPPASFLRPADGRMTWVFALECDEADRVCRPLTRFAACIVADISLGDASSALFEFKKARPLDYQRGVSELRSSYPALYGKILKPLNLHDPERGPVTDAGADARAFRAPTRRGVLGSTWWIAMVVVSLLRLVGNFTRSHESRNVSTPAVAAPAEPPRTFRTSNGTAIDLEHGTVTLPSGKVLRTQHGAAALANPPPSDTLADAVNELERLAGIHASSMPPEVATQVKRVGQTTRANGVCDNAPFAYADLERMTSAATIPDEFAVAMMRVAAALSRDCPGGKR